MAALVKTAVSNFPTDINASELFPFGKGNRGITMRRLKLVLTGQGTETTTEYIGAVALGFSQLLWCSNLWDDQNNKGYPAVIQPVLNVILLLDGAADPTPKAVSSTAAYITVVGTPTY